MYKDMVVEKRLSLQAQVAATFPDGRYPNLFIFMLVPAQGHTVEDNQKELDNLLTQFESTPVDAATLQRVKTKVRAEVVRRLDSNSGLASLLTNAYANYGDWRKIFTEIDDLDKVTAEDVLRVARKYFVAENCTVAYTQLPPPQPRPGRQQ
jgi:predicted Zn-dependent peptidase